MDLELFDLRGLPLDDPLRKAAYPTEPPARLKPGYRHLFEPMTFIHLLSTRWYFDASDPKNADEADRVKRELVAAAGGEFYSDDYRPFRVVVDNFGGTVIGRREDEDA